MSIKERKVKIHIHPDYRYMKPLLAGIPQGKYVTEKIFCNSRNVVEKTTFLGRELVIKRFKVPVLLNRIIYTFFRKSKARRGYEHALKLLDKGVATPFPVAYIEKREGLLFHTGWLVTEYMPYPVMSSFTGDMFTKEEWACMGKDLIAFTAGLNDKGVVPLDFNTGNVFCWKKEGHRHYSFALTDINRMRFGKLGGWRNTLRCFEQFGVTTEHLYKFIASSSLVNDVDTDSAMFLFLFFRLRKRMLKAWKKKIKSLFRGTAEKTDETAA